MPVEYTPFDRELCDAVTFRFNNGPKILFQFPPRITSDGRKGDWKEQNISGSEPVAVFEKSGPREITLTWTYIVDGGTWTTTKIAQSVRDLRGYFARVSDANLPGHRNLIIFFKMWNHGGEQEMSCRIRGVDVKHSDTIVSHCVPNNKRVNEAYPLRTDITVDLRIWTKGGPQETQDLAGLKVVQTVDWY